MSEYYGSTAKWYKVVAPQKVVVVLLQSFCKGDMYPFKAEPLFCIRDN